MVCPGVMAPQPSVGGVGVDPRTPRILSFVLSAM